MGSIIKSLGTSDIYHFENHAVQKPIKKFSKELECSVKYIKYAHFDQVPYNV